MVCFPVCWRFHCLQTQSVWRPYVIVHDNLPCALPLSSVPVRKFTTCLHSPTERRRCVCLCGRVCVCVWTNFTSRCVCTNLCGSGIGRCFDSCTVCTVRACCSVEGHFFFLILLVPTVIPRLDVGMRFYSSTDFTLTFLISQWLLFRRQKWKKSLWSLWMDRSLWSSHESALFMQQIIIN